MALLDKLTDRLLFLLGVEMDFTIDMHAVPFNRIRSALFVGARPRQEDVQGLKHAGITHVVSCLEDGERPTMAFLREEFRSLFIAAHDGMNHDIASSFPQLFDFAFQAPRDHPEAKLLVHCEAGVSRSATLATALLMKSERMRFFEAYSEVRAKRPGVLPNIGFASQLQHLEHALHPDKGAAAETSSLARYLRQVCKVPVEVELLQEMLERHDHDAPRAIRAIFGDDIPRVVQGVRS